MRKKIGLVAGAGFEPAATIFDFSKYRALSALFCHLWIVIDLIRYFNYEGFTQIYAIILWQSVAKFSPETTSHGCDPEAEWSGVEVTELPEAAVFAFLLSEDHMIGDLYPNELSHLDKFPGDANVRLRGITKPAGVIVDNEDR